MIKIRNFFIKLALHTLVEIYSRYRREDVTDQQLATATYNELLDMLAQRRRWADA